MAGFEDDFARGEREAARLVERMRAALKRAEEFESAASKDAALRRRLGQQAQIEAGTGSTAESASSRLTGEEQINRQLRERALLRQREQQALIAQETAIRRLSAMGPSAYTQGILFGPAGGAPRQLPPGGGGALPPGGYYPAPGAYARQLPPGPPPPLQIGPGRQPLGLPAPGQTVGGTKYLEEEARGAQQGARSFGQYEKAQASMGSEQVRFNRSLSESLFIQGQANNQYQRFGALSAEWIGATRRGTTTIQELGRQTAITIGKFGGWLVAGGLLYTAFGALRQVGKGFVEATSGVSQMQRVIDNVNTSRAEGQLRKLSSEFNLPLGEVSEATFGVGKAYHNEAQAFEAAHAALYAVKVGEIDAATSTKYLISIINGFHLPASRMGLLFDQLVVAQKRYAIDLPSLMQGVGKAGGSFKAAGGDVHTLIALITTLQHVSGQSGNVIGTALLRSPHFIATPKNKEILKSFGLNAQADISTLYTEAIDAAQGKSGDVQRKIAEGLFGPQYGSRVGIFLLQNKKLFEEVLGTTSAKHAKGAAQAQLETILGKTSEDIKRIGTELSNMGSNLAEGGFLDLLGGGLKLLDFTLEDVNRLLDLFNELPGPLKTVLAVMLEIRGVMGLLRHFNVGESFKQGSLTARALTSPNQFQKLYKEDVHGQLSALVSERERQSVSISRATIGLNASQAQKVAAEAEYVRLVATQGAESEQALAQKDNVIRATLAVNAAEERKLAAEAAELEILGAQVILEDKKAALASARNEAEARAIKARYGDQVSTTFNRPLSGEEAARQRGYQAVREPGGGVQFVPLPPGASMEGDVKQLASRESILRERLRGTGTAWATLATTQIKAREPINSLKTATLNAGRAFSGTYETGLLAAKAALPAAGSAIARGATALSGLATEAYAFIGGPIGLLIAGAYAAYEWGDDLGKAIAGGQAQIEAAEAALHPQSVKKIKEQLHAAKPIEEKFGYSNPYAETERRLFRVQREHEREGKAAPFLRPEQLEARVKQAEELKVGTKAFDRQVKRLSEEFDAADKAANPKAYKAARDKMRALGAKVINTGLAVGEFFGQFQNLGDKLLLKQVESYTQVVAGGTTFARPSDVRGLVNRTLILGVRNLQSSSAAERSKGIQQLLALPDTLTNYGKAEFDTAIKLASTQAQRDRAYSTFLGHLRDSAKVIRSAFGGERQGVKSKLDTTLRELKHLEASPAAQEVSAKLAHNVGIEPRPEDPRIKELRQRAKRLRAAIDNLDKAQQFQLKQLQAAIREIQLEQVHKHIELFEAHGQISEARIGNKHPVAQAQVALATAKRVLSTLRGAHASDQEMAQALLSVLQAENTLTDAVRQRAQDLVTATAALAEARAHGDPIGAAHAQIQRAGAELKAAQTTADRRNALAALIQAQDQLDEAYAQIAVARIGLRIASTEDPVKQAALRIKQASLEVRDAHGAQARLEAEAHKREAVRDKRDAVSQKRIENIEFDAELERITKDQELAALQHLLKSVDLGRNTRREVQRKIHSLKKELEGESSQFELNVGNIKLPTIYDIRRAIGGGLDQRQQVVYNDNSTNEVHAQVSGGNPDEVMKVMSDAFNRHTRNARRSAGMVPRR